MCVDYDEMEIALWLLDNGMDSTRGRLWARAGSAANTALFATVVSQPTSG